MKFGIFKPHEAKGAILAHSIILSSGKRMRKGLLIGADIIAQLEKDNIKELTAAMPQENDVLEDIAASLIAAQFKAQNIKIEDASTGRVNIFASINGIFRVSAEAINAINAVDPAITIATLKDYANVNQSRLVATIKIIPYAVNSDSLESVLALDTYKAMSLNEFKQKRVGLISTKSAGLKMTVMDKTTNALKQRLALSGSLIVEEQRVEHKSESIAEAVKSLKNKCDMLIIFGASAISDIADCVPKGIEKAGGEVIRFGMPVDPGNLMLLAKLGDMPVIGAPGCARSIAENGFDWVLQRVLADIEVSADEIAQMGVGGLLMETGARSHPRETKTSSQNAIAGIVLAAGQSRRMGAENKMTVEVLGKPMVQHVVQAADQSKLESLSVVTGHEAEAVMKVLEGNKISQVHNPNYQIGLSSSLACGIGRLDAKTSHAMIMLGDMPFIKADMIDVMIAKADENPQCIIVATHGGKRGNPVLWPRKYFDELQSITGDVGAKHILAANQDSVLEVELGEAASLDLDTPAAIKSIQQV